jgi:hypothetical protein
MSKKFEDVDAYARLGEVPGYVTIRHVVAQLCRRLVELELRVEQERKRARIREQEEVQS